MTAARARHIIGVALLALLLAQWAALWHAVAHGPVLSASEAHSAASRAEEHAAHGASRHADPHASAVADPASRAHHTSHTDHASHTSHEAGSPVCQLFDQLLLAPVIQGASPQAGHALWGSERPLSRLPAAIPSTALAAYEARGPPQA